MKQTIAAIIGAGPLGIELAAAFERNGISYVLFDKGQAAQMIANFPPQTRFFSSVEKIAISGIPIQTVDQQKCTREEYLAYLRSVMMHFGVRVNSYEEVIELKHLSEGHFPYFLETLVCGERRQYACRYLVLATGGTSKPRLLGVKGEGSSHVSTKMADPHTYFQKKVLIIGAKNSAVESALRCFHAGAYVSLAIRKEHLDPSEVKYWLLPELLGCITKGQIGCYSLSEVREITLNKVMLQQAGREGFLEVEADFVIKAIGFEADMSLFDQLNLPLLVGDQKRPIYDTDTMETPMHGVFVLGTVVGGTQKKYRVFIENCHDHVFKILSVISKRENLPISEPQFSFKGSFNGINLEE